MYKQYLRLENIHLPEIKKVEGEFRRTIKKRSSFRNFSGRPIDMTTLGDILYFGLGTMRLNPFEALNPFRAYPSAGAKYPLEVYVLVLSGKDINSGLYHYNPEGHSLDTLLLEIRQSKIDKIWLNKKQFQFKKASVLLIITSIFHRTTDKYGERGIMFPYIEAGHLAQNIYLLTTLMGLGCCAIGILNEDPVIKLLDINPRDEYPIYYLALGY